MEALLPPLRELSEALVAALGDCVGLPPGALRGAFGEGEPDITLKVVRYPPRAGADGALRRPGLRMRTLSRCVHAAGLGCGAHSDSGALSLLLQAPGATGLQARNADGAWVDVPPRPGTLVVNLGEMLQLATAGYFLATVHRVVPPAGPAARLSIPYFFNPAHSARVEAMPLPAGLPWAVRACERDALLALCAGACLTAAAAAAQRAAPAALAASDTHAGRNVVLRCAGDNVFKSYARSHPAAFARHHADLVIAPDGAVVPRAAAPRTA